MKLISLLFGLLSASVADALTVRAGMWGPADLKDVEAVLDHILSAHMTPAMHNRAQVVAADVKSYISAVSLGHNMTKSERRNNVTAAIKELAELQVELNREMAKEVKIHDKYTEQEAGLEKQLKTKKDELAQDEKKLQLYKLKKELAEKQLELDNLELEKARGAHSEDSAVEDGKARNEVIKSLLVVANGFKANGTNASLPPQITAILTDLRKHSETIRTGLAKLDGVEKTSEAHLDDVLKNATVGGTTDATAKARSMIQSLKKKEERKFQKLRVVKKTALSELDTAIASIEKGDAATLQKTLAKMQAETKAVNAKSGHFLY